MLKLIISQYCFLTIHIKILLKSDTYEYVFFSFIFIPKKFFIQIDKLHLHFKIYDTVIWFFFLMNFTELKRKLTTGF
jgi:Na+/H+ antiporter NhaA